MKLNLQQPFATLIGQIEEKNLSVADQVELLTYAMVLAMQGKKKSTVLNYLKQFNREVKVHLKLSKE